MQILFIQVADGDANKPKVILIKLFLCETINVYFNDQAVNSEVKLVQGNL